MLVVFNLLMLSFARTSHEVEAEIAALVAKHEQQMEALLEGQRRESLEQGERAARTRAASSSRPGLGTAPICPRKTTIAKGVAPAEDTSGGVRPSRIGDPDFEEFWKTILPSHDPRRGGRGNGVFTVPDQVPTFNPSRAERYQLAAEAAAEEAAAQAAAKDVQFCCLQPDGTCACQPRSANFHSCLRVCPNTVNDIADAIYKIRPKAKELGLSTVHPFMMAYLRVMDDDVYKEVASNGYNPSDESQVNVCKTKFDALYKIQYDNMEDGPVHVKDQLNKRLLEIAGHAEYGYPGDMTENDKIEVLMKDLFLHTCIRE